MQQSNMTTVEATSTFLNSQAYVAPLDYGALPKNPNFLLNRKNIGLQELVQGASMLYGNSSRLSEVSLQKASQYGIVGFPQSTLSGYMTRPAQTSQERVDVLWNLVNDESQNLIDRLQSGVKNRGEALKIVRKLRGISATEAAELSGKSSNTWRTYERNEHLTDKIYSEIMGYLMDTKFKENVEDQLDSDYSNLPNAKGLFKNQELGFPERVKRAGILYGSLNKLSGFTDGRISKSSLASYSLGEITHIDIGKVELIDRLIAEETNRLVQQLQSGQVAHDGEEIRILRRLAGKTLREVANDTGINVNTLQGYETYGKIHNKKNYDKIVEYLTNLEVSDAVLPVSDEIKTPSIPKVFDASQSIYSDPQENYNRLNLLVTELTTGPSGNTMEVAENIIREVLSIAYSGVGNEGIEEMVESYTKDMIGPKVTMQKVDLPKSTKENASLIPLQKYGKNPQEVVDKISLLFYGIIESLDVLKSEDKVEERDSLGEQISKADIGYFTSLIRAMLDGRDRYQGFMLNIMGVRAEGNPPKGLELMIRKSGEK